MPDHRQPGPSEAALAPLDRFRPVALGIAGVWVLVELVRVALKNQGDIYNHIQFGKRFLAGTDIYAGGLNFVYPPLWAMVFSPLALVPVGVGQVLLFIVGFAAMAMLFSTVARLASRDLPLGPRGAFWSIVVAVLLASAFISRDMQDCFVNTIIIALVWLGIRFWSQRREAAGGFCLGLSIALKCSPLLTLFFFAWKRQWRMVGWTVLATLLFTLAPALRMGWGGPDGFERHIRSWAGEVQRGMLEKDPSRGVLGEESTINLALKPAIARYLMHLPYGHLGRPESPEQSGQPDLPPNPLYIDFLRLDPPTAGLIVKGVMLALLAWTFWRFRGPADDRGSASLMAEFAAVGLLTLLYSPITWKQHCVAVIPALVVIVRAGWVRGLPRGVTACVAAYLLLCIVVGRHSLGKSAGLLLDSYHIKTFGLLCLFAATVCVSRREATKNDAAPEGEPASASERAAG